MLESTEFLPFQIQDFIWVGYHPCNPAHVAGMRYEAYVSANIEASLDYIDILACECSEREKPRVLEENQRVGTSEHFSLVR